MIKRMNIGGNIIEVEYQEAYRPDSIKIDGIEYSMTRYAEKYNGKNWEATPGGNVLFYASENGRFYAIPQKKFTEGTSEAQKRATAKYEATKARITIRVTPEEKKEVCRQAAKAGKSVNEYCRGIILNKEAEND